MTLFELDERIQAVLDEHLNEDTGEISDEGVEALEKLEMAREEKLLQYALAVKNLKIEGSVYDAEIKAMRARGGAVKRNHDRVRDKLRDALLEDGKAKIKDPRVSVWWSKTHRVVADEGALVADLPDRFVRREVIEEPDLVAIKEELGKPTKDQDPEIAKRYRLIPNHYIVVR